MADAEISGNFDAALSWLDSLHEPVINAVEYGMIQGAENWIGVQKKTQMNGRPGLNAPTGNMRDSWYVRNNGHRTNFVVSVANGPHGWYARLHQDGGRFTSTGKMFSIPISSMAKGKAPAAWPKGELHLMKSKNGNLLLFGKHGKRGRVELHYLLKRTITIPKRLFMPERWPDVVDMMRSRVAAMLRKLPKAAK